MSLELQQDNKKYLFPGLKETIKVKFYGNLDFFNYICNDKRFIALPQKIDQMPFCSYIAEAIEIRQTHKYVFEIDVKIIERVKV